MGNAKAMQWATAITEALGLDPGSVTSIDLRVKPMSVTADVRMVVELKKGKGLVPVLRKFELKERDDG